MSKDKGKISNRGGEQAKESHANAFSSFENRPLKNGNSVLFRAKK